MQSGYKTITPIQFANILWLLEEGTLSKRDAQTYFGCFALVAIREAATRYKKCRREKPRDLPRYRLNELVRLTGLPPKAVKRSLSRLRRQGLVDHREGQIFIITEPLPGSNELSESLSCRRSPKRPIPVPRSAIRFLAGNPTLSLTKTLIGYLVRGLSISRQGGEISNRGTAKVSWISETLGLSERAVRYARKTLIELGCIESDEGSHQLKLNRDGAYFVLNLECTFVKREKKVAATVPDFAPLPPEKCTDFAPPNKDKKTSIEIKHQETLPPAKPAGVFLERKEHPNLWDIKPEDLWHFGRLEELYFQASKAGWIKPCEAMALNFLAAAVRAREAGNDPPRFFVALIRKRLWSHITQAQEDRGRAALVKYREENPDRFRVYEARQAA
jgi:Mn-dependent DtxR family transcriptional regulator